MSGNKPEKKFKAGGISATVWLNKSQTKNGQAMQYKTVVIERSYKDNNNEWKNTKSFRVNDLPKVALLINKAYEYLIVQSAETGNADNTTTTEEEVVL